MKTTRTTRRCLLPVLVFGLLVTAGLGQRRDPDRDGDGLSDFDEIHKYRTDPTRADTDGDGRPDGDWAERREFTYSIRAVVHVMPSYDPTRLCDERQDGRLLYACKEYGELEIVSYPFATGHEAIGDGARRRPPREIARYVKAGPTTNWDGAMRRDLLRRLKSAGIDVSRLSKKETVTKVAAWALEHAPSLGRTCAWGVAFAKNRPFVPEGLAGKVDDMCRAKGWTRKELFAREIFGKGMYEHRTRGTCTTSANYLTTVLKAVGIPTRMIISIPLADTSSQRQVEMVGARLTNRPVRRAITRALERLRGSFASHTMNEVWVDGRWRLLNYARLGQPALDEQFFGLLLRVHTFDDLATGKLGGGWGVGRLKKTDVFRFNNPYSLVTVSDLMGPHADRKKLKLPDDDFPKLTVSKAYWFHSEHRPASIGADWHGARDRRFGHILVHIDEGHPGKGSSQFVDFFDEANKQFTLRAAGQPDVPAEAVKSWWAAPERGLCEFYLRIRPEDYRRMAKGVSYRLSPPEVGKTDRRWVVRENVALAR